MSETETVICGRCGFTTYNFGSNGTRFVRCSDCQGLAPKFSDREIENGTVDAWVEGR